MTPVKKGSNRKKAARLRLLREVRKKKWDEARSQTTKEQVAILLKTWSRRGIVGGPAEPM